MRLTAAGRRWPRGLRALSHRNFRLYWSGQLVSFIGTWMAGVAQGWLVLELTNDPLALALVATCQFAPALLLGLFGGVIADVLPKRRTFIILQALSLAQALVLGLLVGTGTVQTWHVYALALTLGVIGAVEMPVRQSFAVEMVGREDVANAIALNSAVFNGARIIGPALAGILIGIAGLAASFYINAASYLAAMIALVLLREEELRTPPTARFERSFAGVAEQLREGLSYVRHTPAVLLPISVLGFVSTFGMNFQVTVPVLARNVLAGGPDTYGFLMAAAGVGSLLGALAIAFRGRPTLRLVVVGAAVFGAALILLALSRVFALSIVLMVVLGWAVIAIAATANTVIQLTVPDVLRGRVMSVYTTVFAGSTPVGALFAGTLATLGGVSVALFVGGALTLLTAAAAGAAVFRGRGIAVQPMAQQEAGRG